MTMPYKPREGSPFAPGDAPGESGPSVATEAQDASQGRNSASQSYAKSSGSALVSVFVPGKPVPKGSLERSRYGKTYWPKHATDWCDTMATACQADYRQRHGASWPPRSGPVGVSVSFGFQRPASHATASRRGLRVGRAPKGMPECTNHQLGDLDKLARNVLDALVNGKVIVDDSHVTTLVATKYYVDAPEVGGVQITVIP